MGRVDLSRRATDGTSALHLAAQAGHATVLQILLRKGASADARDTEGRSALDLAISAGAHAAIDLLRPITTVAPRACVAS